MTLSVLLILYINTQCYAWLKKCRIAVFWFIHQYKQLSCYALESSIENCNANKTHIVLQIFGAVTFFKQNENDYTLYYDSYVTSTLTFPLLRRSNYHYNHFLCSIEVEEPMICIGVFAFILRGSIKNY